MANSFLRWHCSICNRDFNHPLGKASHYAGKSHQDNLKKHQQEKERRLND